MEKVPVVNRKEEQTNHWIFDKNSAYGNKHDIIIYNEQSSSSLILLSVVPWLTILEKL